MKRFFTLTLAIALLLSCIPAGVFSVTANAETDGIYTITYHLDGGTNAAKNPDIYTEEDTITLKDASKVGYDFAGWFLDSNKTEKIVAISNMGDVAVYAKFVPKTYTATFNDNGATKSSTLTITLDDTLGTIKTKKVNNNETFDPYSYWIPTRDGYVFAGWYVDSKIVSDILEIKSDITLIAKWNQCEQYGSRENPVVLGENSAAVGSEGAGFFYNEEYTYSWPAIDRNMLESDGDSSSASGWEYVYVYVSGKYIELNYEAECGARDDRYKIGYCEIYDVTNQKELVPLPNDPYASRWNSYSGGLEVEPGSLLRIGVGYYMSAGYEKLWGKIRISLGEPRTTTISAKNERIVEQEFNSFINVPSVSKTGYNFLGWYDSQGNQMTETWQYTGDQTFTAKWQPQGYEITYELVGGVNSPANPIIYTIEDTITLKDPTKPGYTFKGWYLDANFKTQVTSISNKTGNITLYAKWEVNSYNLTLDANTGVFAPKVTFISDGAEIKSCYLYEQDTITAYRPDDKDGYIFAGWYKNDTFTSLYKFNGTITYDITLYAKWVECDSNIINVESAGNIDAAIQGKKEQLYAFVPLADGKITVTSESNNLDLYGILYDANKNSLTSADDISSTDLDFTYTYNVKAGQLYYISVKGNTASTAGQAVINIGWTGNCTITGTTYQNRQLTVVYDTNFKLPQKPVREGYVFLGWFDENDMLITDGTWNFVTDKSLTAKWEEATYHTVVFKDLDGNVISSETYYLSEDIVAPALPTKAPDETYIYHAKWDNNYTGVCTGDTTYTVTYVPIYIDYTVEFKNWDGTVLSVKTYHYGDEVTPPSDPTKAADSTYTYTFSGWDQQLFCNGNMVITAVYKITHNESGIIFKIVDNEAIIIDYVGNGGELNIPSTLYGYPVTTIKDFAFSSCDSLTSVVFPSSITNIGRSAFSHCNNLVCVSFLDGELYSSGVTKIGDEAFRGCAKLTYLTLSRNVESIGTSAFAYCYRLQHVLYTSTYTMWGKLKAKVGTGNEKLIESQVHTSAKGDECSTVLGFEGDLWHCSICNTHTYIECQVKSIRIAERPAKQSYFGKRDELDVSGGKIEVTASDSTGGSRTFVVDMNISMVSGFDNTTAGVQVLTVSYLGFTTTFKVEIETATVQFVDYDGTVISNDEYMYGDIITVPESPRRTSDNTYTYTFAGWDKEVVGCAGDATYTATYTSNYIGYTVVFKDWNGDVLSTKTYHYGDKVTAPADPTKAADETYTYTFAGWDQEVAAVSGDAVYTATYKETYIDYTVVFKDWNGEVISTKTYHYGDIVEVPADPTKAADETYTYAFNGWDKGIVDCAGDATYTATYTPDFIDYTVVFKNWNGDVLSTKTYHYGDTAEVPANPTREANNTYTYDFIGWDKTVSRVTGDAVYTATYTSNYIDYTVVFKNWNGDVLSTKTYHWGDKVTAPAAPTKTADNTYTYTFAGWDKEVVDCAGDTIYTAIYTPQKKPVTTLIIDGEEVEYTQLNDAVAAAPKGGTLQLTRDTEEDVAISKTLVFDLNGFNITGNITVAPGATLSVKDSQTDDYTIEDSSGYGKIVGTISGIQADDGYMMVSEADGTSFHRIDLKTTAMALRSSEVGIYYMCNFAGDEIVAQHVDHFGVALSVEGEPNVNVLGAYSRYDNFVPGNGGNDTNGTLLYGVMKTTNDKSINARNAEIAIYGRPYILTKDGQYIFGECHSRSFREQVELVDTQWNELTAEQQLTVLEMYQTYKSIMVKWSTPHIRAAM